MKKSNTVRQAKQARIRRSKNAEVNEFKIVNELLLEDSMGYLPDWLPGGKKVGNEYVCGSIHGGSGSSFSVNLNHGKWLDRADEDYRGGDLVSLYAKCFDVSQSKAMTTLKAELGLEGISKAEYREMIGEAREKAKKRAEMEASEEARIRARAQEEGQKINHREPPSHYNGYLRLKGIEPVSVCLRNVVGDLSQEDKVRAVAEQNGEDVEQALQRAFATSILALPVYNIDGKVHGYQSIQLRKEGPTGRLIEGLDLAEYEVVKKFFPGTAIKGHFFPILDSNEDFILLLRGTVPDQEDDEQEEQDEAAEPGTVEEASADWDKYYKANASVSEEEDLRVKEVLVCEGYATGASLFMATKIPTIVAFSAGNIEPVIGELRRKNPDLNITICADFDKESRTGQRAAQKAARKHGCSIVYPHYTDRSMDFNDVHAKDGLDKVRRLLAGAEKIDKEEDLDFQVAQDIEDITPEMGEALVDGLNEETTPEEEVVRNLEAVQQQSRQDLHQNNKALKKVTDHPDVALLKAAPFVPCGALQVGGVGGTTRYCFYSRRYKRVHPYSLKDLGRPEDLAECIPFGWIAESFGNEDDKIDKTRLREWLLEQSNRVGDFSPTRLRGRGAWPDYERIVINEGNHLVVDGLTRDLGSLDSPFIYLRGEDSGRNPRKQVDPLTDEESRALAQLCCEVKWGHPHMGRYFAGWLALAPIGGVLDWRPHVYLTGDRGTGKTWYRDHVVQTLLGAENVIAVNGKTTEAGVRSLIGQTSLPVLFDEFEPDSADDQAHYQRIRNLARQSSSGGTVAKGSASGEANLFVCRSMFMFCSIGVSFEQAADETRTTVLELTEVVRLEAGAPRNPFQDLLTPEYCRRFRERVFHLAPVILHNARRFLSLGSKYLADTRAAAQLGALLAGFQALLSSVPWTDAEIEELAREIGQAQKEQRTAPVSDTNLALQTILDHVIEVEEDGRRHRMTVFEVCSELADTGIGPVRQSSLERALGHCGLKMVCGKDFKDGVPGTCYLFIENKHEKLRSILANTPCHAGWNTFLRRVPGALGSSTHRVLGQTKRGTCVPIETGTIPGISADLADFGLWSDAENPEEYDL